MLWALIMAGGQGTRLWPLSSKTLPKPFLKLIPGRDTLFSETLKRLSPAIPASRIFVIGNENHLPLLRQLAPRVPRKQIIGEPVSKNTAATVALAASLILKEDPQALLLILPADHWIGNRREFQRAVRTAARFSDRREQFSIFGVPPAFPSPSYGYMRMGKKLAPSIYEVTKFIEKPSAPKAQRLIKSGQYLWHAGIFLASAANLFASVARYSPKLAGLIFRLKIKNGKILNPKLFKTLPSVSFDYAVLEKITNAVLIRCTFDWCDIGSWNSMAQIWQADGEHNHVFGRCMPIDAGRNIVYSGKKWVCLQGVHDLVVVNTPDVLFVGRRNAGESMREVAEQAGKAEQKR